jgi:hypothetical protein
MKSKQPKKTEAVPPAPYVAPDRRAHSWLSHAGILLGLVVANFVLYAGTIGLGFFSVDDADYVQNNPYIENFHGTNVEYMLTKPYFANYAPANLLSYALDVRLAGGKKADSMHLSNVMWHGWVVAMVYLLAFIMRGEMLTAAAAALLFMLHPTHVEVVAWISSRKDLVATGFAVLSMGCYILWRRGAGKPGALKSHHWWYAASLVSFLVASAAKQSVLLLPAVMLVWDVLFEKRRSWQMFVDKVPFGMMTIFFGLMTWGAQPSTKQELKAFGLAATELTNLWLLTGFGQYVLYRPAPDPAAWSQIIRLALVVVAVVFWIVPFLFLPSVLAGGKGKVESEKVGKWESRKVSWESIMSPTGAQAVVLWYWVLIQMIPPMLLGFIVPITDRYLFLPSVGVCLLVVFGARSISQRLPKVPWVGWLLPVGLATVWGFQTGRYIQEWRDPRTVWYGAHLKVKTAHVFEYLGDVYQEAGERINNFIKSRTPLQVTNELRMAKAELGDSKSVEPLRAEWLGAAPTLTNSMAYRDRLWNSAWEHYQSAAARRGTISTPNLFMNRGRLLVNLGKFEPAITEFQIALRFAQDSTYDLVRMGTSTHALYAIGVAYWNMRNYKEARKWLEKAQALQRKSPQIWIPTLDHDLERVTGLAQAQP